MFQEQSLDSSSVKAEANQKLRSECVLMVLEHGQDYVSDFDDVAHAADTLFQFISKGDTPRD